MIDLSRRKASHASPCVREFKLTPKERSTSNWARRNLHNMDYEPKLGDKRCQDMTRVVKRLIRDYGIEIVAYKG